MKRASEVGRDFDRYAEKWRREEYELEVGGSGHGVEKEPSDLVQYPGDEWGSPEPLRRNYEKVAERFLPRESVNVLEIGAGAGRSTVVLLEVLAERVADYHVVDVSERFVQVLKERVSRPLEVHIVDDVDLSALPKSHFDVVLAQSSWSHISLYDQYRYLRDLRQVIRPGGLVFVSGQFLLGIGHDWTWNRFVNRVAKMDRNRENEILHEFTSVAALAEMLVRLGYEIACISASGFLARVGGEGDGEPLASITEPIRFPYNVSIYDFLATGRHEMVGLPFAGTWGDIRKAPEESAPPKARPTPRLPRVRALAVRVPGARLAVRRIRAWRKGIR